MKDVTFQLDPKGGAEILQNMMMPTIKQAADAIASRAQSMADSISSHPPDIKVTTKVGTIKRGMRAIATIKAEAETDKQYYVGNYVLPRAKDAGRR